MPYLALASQVILCFLLYLYVHGLNSSFTEVLSSYRKVACQYTDPGQLKHKAAGM